MTHKGGGGSVFKDVSQLQWWHPRQ